MHIETSILKYEKSISVIIYTKDGEKHVKSQVSAILRTDKKEYILLPESISPTTIVYYAASRPNCIKALGDGVFEAKYEGKDVGEIKSVEVLAVKGGKTERQLIEVN
ncbi:MAG: hypothetical protein KAI53_02395 [Candidatus Aenigmarchaeota archaeon]|nr:hypothetical protein [Candidatus Aenigmarchaeota archaeon]